MKQSKIIAREKKATALEIIKAGQVFSDLVNIMLQGVAVYENEGASFSELNRQGFSRLFDTYGLEILDYGSISNYIPEVLKHIPSSKHLYFIYLNGHTEGAWVIGYKNAEKVRQEFIETFITTTPFCEREYREKRELESMIQRIKEGKFRSSFSLSDLKGRLAEVNQHIREQEKERLNYYRKSVVIEKLS